MIKTDYQLDYELDYEIFETSTNNTKSKPQIWLAFHGIGQNTEAFKYFANQNNFKIYSFGLFYHEKNHTHLEKIAKNTRETTLKNWLFLMQQFLEKEFKKEQIDIEDTSINIIGFSLGTRPALQFVSNFSKLSIKNNFISINKIVLIAPETLAISRWYRFGTQTLMGKFLLKKIIISDSFKKIITSISSLIFSKNAQKLIRYQIYHGINSLAFAWIAYRPFEIYGRDWTEISKDFEDKITIVASENDNFVKLKKIHYFIKKNRFDNRKSIKWIISKSAHAYLLKEFRV